MSFLFALVFGFCSTSAGYSADYQPVIAHPSDKLDPRSPRDFPRILDRISAALIGRAYVLGPLGEGEDKEHPPYRLDAFDCTTFLETVMANARCYGRDGRCVEARMRAIRYAGGKVSFVERNHIPELDWLPRNSAKGLLQDLSGELFPGEWKSAAPTIDREAWLASKGHPAKLAVRPRPPLQYLPVSFFFVKNPPDLKAQEELESAVASLKKETELKLASAAIGEGEREELKSDFDRKKFRLELAFLKGAFSPAEERLAAIPSGTVLNLVHAAVKDPAKAKLATLISHQGLVLQTGKGTRIRHASPGAGHVSDQSLADYLLRYVRSANYRGVSFFRILPERTVK